MNNKKYKTTMGTIVGLMVLSGGLFAYENVYVAKQQEANTAVIFIAKQDIQAHTSIKADMFQPVQIQANSVLPGYVLNLQSVVGKELKGGLLQGEPLTNQRLDEKGALKQGELILKIVPDAVGEIKDNDNVKIYVQLVNKDTGESTVKELFKNKKISKQSESDSALLGGEKDKTGSFQIQATEQEVKDYYIAKNAGSILVVKINELDTEAIKSDKEVEKFDANSEDVKNSSKTTTSEEQGQAIITYAVKEGDTLDSLALKFKTKNETIRSLNNGKEKFEVGEMIQVPAN